ncbi:MAG TPA: hypothetical protein VK400_06445 [Pyrinomonadaceae bacterium]|nr:hypothetical protein [Pyrinomonadaceae bacterium]
MDYELVLKIVAALVGGGFFLAVRQIFVAYINKNKEKKLRFRNTRGEVVTQGDLTPNEAILIKEFFAITPNNHLEQSKNLSEYRDD